MTLESCCCCLELKTGSLIIGYLSLLTDVALSYAIIIGLVASRVVMEEGRSEEVQTIGAILFVILFFDLALVTINLLFAIILLVGIHKNKRGYIRTYLIASTAFVIISIIIFPSSIATGAATRNIVVDFISIAVNIYSLMVIRSYLKHVEDERVSIDSEMA